MSSMRALQANRSIAVAKSKITDDVSRMESHIALHAWKANIKQRALKRQIDVEQVRFRIRVGLRVRVRVRVRVRIIDMMMG
jgi:hypothetical protein